MTIAKPASELTSLRDQEYELVATSVLRPHPKNARKGDTAAIFDSIGANGFYGACVVQKSTGYILAGNHRWKAARRAKLPQIPVIWLDVDDDRAMRILLVDNRTNDVSGYDDTALAAILSELAGASDLTGTGYDEGDLDKLLGELAKKNRPVEDVPIPDSLLLLPTWNRVRTVAFLSVRKWAVPIKHDQCQALRARKDAGDLELAGFVAKDCAEILLRMAKRFDGWTVTCPPGSRSTANGHFAWSVVERLAGLLGAEPERTLEGAQKRTKSVHELEAKQTLRLTTEHKGGNVVLFDDVATTRTTIEYATKALSGFTVLPIAWIYQEAVDSGTAEAWT